MAIRSVICAVAVLAGAAAAAPPKAHELSADYTFEAYLEDFGKAYACPMEFAKRRALFFSELDEVLMHNAKPDQSYKKGVNHMSDWTPEEKDSVKGLHRSAMFNSKSARSNKSLLKMAPRDLPASKDWREDNIVTAVKDQGNCGSCWAFAGTESIESYAAKSSGSLFNLSEQAYVSCVPNPDGCGGSGGCDGATSELLFEYAMDNGGVLESTYPYEGVTGTCNSELLAEPVVSVGGYTLLPRNDYDSVIQALATVGPMAIAINADFSSYESGVLPSTGCGSTINHGVQLVGYGTDAETGMDYWLVRNSWSSSWGEAGYIRIERQGEDAKCTTDFDNQMGIGCTADPKTVTVCGSCAILYDVSYPTDVSVVSSKLSN